MDGAHVDDAAAPLLVHLPQRRARGEERTIKMDRQQLLPFCELEVDNRRNDLNSGVAHENVECSEFLDHLRGADIHLLLVGHIHRYADGALAGGINLMGGRIGAVTVEIGNSDDGSLPSKYPRDLLADSTGCARYNGN